MILVALLLGCQLSANCPLIDKDRLEKDYPYYHNTRIESPMRKHDNNNYDRPVPLDEYIKFKLRK